MVQYGVNIWMCMWIIRAEENKAGLGGDMVMEREPSGRLPVYYPVNGYIYTKERPRAKEKSHNYMLSALYSVSV